MKNPTALRNIEQAGSLDTGSAVAMTISADGMNVVMSMLSNLYSNGNEAVVREYSCNARDSHVEAGQTLPIEVTLPTALDPQFKVQDYGIGLSKDGILQTYAQYGMSTKRDSNEQIGAFGIGSKSAFTVGNQFTVTGVKDGEKTIAMFSLQQDGTPTVQILFHGPTEEGNGVLVDVGVENVEAIREAAKKLFPSWKPGTILVDGEEPESIWEGVEEIAQGVYIDLNPKIDKDRYGRAVQQLNNGERFKLLMGGVPYLIPSSLWREIPPQARSIYDRSQYTPVTYIMDVPIGSVEITPSREELRVTPLTKSTVVRMLELIDNSMPGWITKKMDSATSLWDASRIYKDLAKKINYKADPQGVYWNGTSLGKAYYTFTFPLYCLGTNYRSADPSRRYRVESIEACSFNITGDNFDEDLFVHSIPQGKEHLVRTYAKTILLHGDQGYKRIVAVDRASHQDGWFGWGPNHESKIGLMSFADYHALGKELRKANRTPAAALAAARTGTRYATQVPGGVGTTFHTAAEIAALGKKVLYRTYRGWKLNTYDSLHGQRWGKGDLVIVTLTGTQKLEILEKNLGVTPLPAQKFFADYAKKIIKGITQADLDLFQTDAQADNLNDDAIKFVNARTGEITNRAVLDAVSKMNNLRKAKTDPVSKARLSLINAAYDNASLFNPHLVDSDEEDYFKVNLPLFFACMANRWYTDRMLDGADKTNDALISYINSTTV